MVNRMYSLATLLIAFLVLAGCGPIGCGMTKVRHSSRPIAPSDQPYYGQASLRERILDAEVIARVRLRSVAPVGATTAHKNDPRPIPALDFTFDVLEYLHGSGGNTVVARAYALENAEVPWGTPSDTREAEQIARDEVLPFRDSRWDDREAVVFLRPPLKSGEPYLFGYIGKDPQTDSYSPSYGERITTRTLQYKLTVADDLYRAWLPATATTTARGTSSNTHASKEQRFLLDDPAATTTSFAAVSGRSGQTATTTAQTISKSSLREKIAEMDRLVASFDSDAAKIRACLSRKDARERRQRVEAAAGIPQIQHVVTHRVGSGLPAGTGIEWKLIDLPGETERDWFGHGDAHLFNVDKTNVTTVRPIPAGSYLTFYDAKIKGRGRLRSERDHREGLGLRRHSNIPRRYARRVVLRPLRIQHGGRRHHHRGHHHLAVRQGHRLPQPGRHRPRPRLHSHERRHHPVAGSRLRHDHQRRRADVGSEEAALEGRRQAHAPRPHVQRPHAHGNAYTHGNADTHTHAHGNTYAHAYTHTHRNAYTYSHADAHGNAHAHGNAYTRSQSHRQAPRRVEVDSQGQIDDGDRARRDAVRPAGKALHVTPPDLDRLVRRRVRHLRRRARGALHQYADRVPGWDGDRRAGGGQHQSGARDHPCRSPPRRERSEPWS